MNAKRKSTLVVLGLAALLLALVGTAWAANPNPSVTVSVSPQKSTQLMVAPGQDGNNWTYSYTIHDGESVTDTLPINVCVTLESGTWVSFDIDFGSGAGGNLSDSQVTRPGELSFSYTAPENLPLCHTADIEVNTGVLTLDDPNTAQNFSRNFNIGPNDKNPNNLSVGTGQQTPNVKVEITVLPLTASHISCFITDSSGEFLTNCLGEMVSDSGSLDGRFAIVVNNKKNIQVATNPGQFYYNVLWENTTGDPQTVSVSFVRDGVNPQGAQAIHALAFAPPFDTISMDDFNAVNEGLPGGSDDLIENITVPNGWTLWVSYHLEWDEIGGSASGLGTTCSAANKLWHVTATVSGSGISSEMCPAGAAGYKK